MRGDDGDRQEGESWPNPEITDNGVGTVTDNLTALMWMQNGGTVSIGECGGGSRRWKEAFEYVAVSQHY